MDVNDSIRRSSGIEDLELVDLSVLSKTPHSGEKDDEYGSRSLVTDGYTCEVDIYGDESEDLA